MSAGPKIQKLKESLTRSQKEIVKKEEEQKKLKLFYDSEIRSMQDHINLLKKKTDSSFEEQLKCEKEKSMMFYKALTKKQQECENGKEAKMKLREMEEQVCSLETELKQLRTTEIERIKETENLKKKLKEIDSEAIRKIKDEFKAKLAENIEHIFRNFNILTNKISNIDMKLEILETRQSQLFSLKPAEKRLGKEIEKLKSEKLDLQKTIEKNYKEHIKDMTTYEAEIEKLKRKNKILLQELQESKQSYEFKLKKKSSELEDTREKLGLLEDKKEKPLEYFSTIQGLTEDNKELLSNIQELQKKTRDLDKELTECKIESNKLKLETFLKEQSISELKGSLMAAQSELALKSVIERQEFSESYPESTACEKPNLVIEKSQNLACFKEKKKSLSLIQKNFGEIESQQEDYKLNQIFNNNTNLQIKTEIVVKIESNNKRNEETKKNEKEIKKLQLKTEEISAELIREKNNQKEAEKKLAEILLKNEQLLIDSEKNKKLLSKREIELEELQENFISATSKLQELKSSYQAKLEYCQEILLKLSGAEKQNLENLSLVQVFQQKIAENEEDLHNKSELITDLRSLLQSYKVQVSASEDKIKSLEKSVESLSKSLNESLELRRKMIDLNNSIIENSTLAEESFNLSEDLDTLKLSKSNIDSLIDLLISAEDPAEREKIINSLKAEIKISSIENFDQIKSKIQKLQQKIKVLKENYRVLISKHELEAEENQLLQKKILNLNEKVKLSELLFKEIDEFKTQIRSLEDENKKLRELTLSFSASEDETLKRPDDSLSCWIDKDSISPMIKTKTKEDILILENPGSESSRSEISSLDVDLSDELPLSK